MHIKYVHVLQKNILGFCFIGTQFRSTSSPSFRSEIGFGWKNKRLFCLVLAKIEKYTYHWSYNNPDELAHCGDLTKHIWLGTLWCAERWKILQFHFIISYSWLKEMFWINFRSFTKNEQVFPRHVKTWLEFHLHVMTFQNF